jgi:hypothetical protein
MNDAMETVLRLVAEGRLTAEEAGPILDAIGRRAPRGTAGTGIGEGTATTADAEAGAAELPPRYARLEVRDRGRRVVDLRIPVSLGRFALDRIPGLSFEQIAEVQQAIASNARGPIVDVQDADGDGVRIILE